MTAVIIFWAALIAMIFFLFSTVFKGLAAMLEGGIVAIAWTIIIGVFGLAIVALLGVIYSIAAGAHTGELFDVLGYMVMIVIAMMINIAILGGLGMIALQIVIAVLSIVINMVSGILEGLSAVCDMAYLHFLNVIMKRLDKC